MEDLLPRYFDVCDVTIPSLISGVSVFDMITCL